MRKKLTILIVGLASNLLAGLCFAADATDIEIHGFASQGYLTTTENNFITDSDEGSFEFSEMGINFGKELTDKLRVGVQFFARDFGEMDNNQIIVDWAYADFRFQDWFGLRFGQLKTPHGFYNETRDIDMLRNPIFLPQSVYQEITRSVTLSLQGVGIYGYLDMDALGGFSYQAMYGTQTVGQDSRLSEALIGYPSNVYDNDENNIDTKYAGSFGWDTPLNILRLGVSYNNTKMSLLGHWNRTIVAGAFDIGDPIYMDYDKYANWVYSLEFVWQDLMLMAEYIQTKKKFEYKLFDTTEKNDSDGDGWYVNLTYRFSPWFELGGYYSESHSNYDDPPDLQALPDYYNYLEDICITTRFDINESWTFKLEYHNLTGSYGLSARDNPGSSATNVSAVDFFEKEWSMYAAKLTVAF